MERSTGARAGTPTQVLFAVSTTIALWASAFVAIRFVGRQLSPGPLALGRLLIGSVALGALMLARGDRPPRGRAFWFSILSGVLWFGVYNVALNAAERRVDAGVASLLVNTGPVFIAILAGVLLREGFPRPLLIGCVVSFSGAAVIGVAISQHGVQATWGAALCIVAALAYATGLIAQKPALGSASALSVTWTACSVAALACLPWAPSLVGEVGRARPSAVIWTVYLGLGPTAIGFGLWAFALARTDAGRLSVTTYLVPPLAVVIGWMLLGEVPPALALPGGLLCLAGVAIARRQSRPGGRASPSGQSRGSMASVGDR